MLHVSVAFPSCRHVLTALAFFGFINIYCLRVNLSVALVAMVNTSYIRELDQLNRVDNGTGALLGPCETDQSDRALTLANGTNDTAASSIPHDVSTATRPPA